MAMPSVTVSAPSAAVQVYVSVVAIHDVITVEKHCRSQYLHRRLNFSTWRSQTFTACKKGALATMLVKLPSNTTHCIFLWQFVLDATAPGRGPPMACTL
jgi:hypothetical protein